MTDPSSNALSVIATRLPYIDRRALSQAWFSALHVASDGPGAASAHDRRGLVASDTHARAKRGAGATTAQQPTAFVRTPAATRARIAGAELATRRTFDARTAAAARTSFARARSYPPFRSSLTLNVASERVQLLLRRDGATLHVIAVCRPEIAQTVRRALASADAHLRLRGEAVRSTVEITPAVRA